MTKRRKIILILIENKEVLMLFVSDKLKAAVKLSNFPSYEIAHQANLDPSTLSKLICVIAKIKDQDRRVIAVGRVLGIPPDECFQEILSQ